MPSAYPTYASVLPWSASFGDAAGSLAAVAEFYGAVALASLGMGQPTSKSEGRSMGLPTSPNWLLDEPVYS